MNKTIATAIFICTVLTAGVFGQQEIPMFFDNEMMLQRIYYGKNRTVASNSDWSKIALVFNHQKIVIWDTATGREITRLAGHDEPISDIVFSPNGRHLVSCSGSDSAIKIWDTTSGSLIRSIKQVAVSAVSFSPDGNHIIGAYQVSSNECNIKIWNTANGSEVRTLVGHTNSIWSVTYSPNGRQILTASDDRSIRIWDAGNGQILKVINSEAQFRNAIYSPNGRHIAVSSIDRRNRVYAIRIYNAETGQEIRVIPIQVAGYFYIVYSPDGRQLLFNTYDDNGNRIIKIFDPETGRELRTFNNGEIAINFSPDGRRILSTSFELKIENNPYRASYATLLDATTGKVTGTIGYGPLNVGARAYADLQIARFLGDTAAVNRHEAILQYITGRGNATRAEIEKFYRDNERSLIAGIVSGEFNKVSFLFENSAKTKGYNAVLTRNPQNGEYELSYERPEIQNSRKELSAQTLAALLVQMQNNTEDFDKACIDAVRAQAKLIPAEVYERNNRTDLTTLTNILTDFYIDPTRANYEKLLNEYTVYRTVARRPEMEPMYMSLRRTLTSLNPALADRVARE